jgi:hypothetical protein
VLGPESAIKVIEIGPEILEIRGAHKRPEGAPHDTLRSCSASGRIVAIAFLPCLAREARLIHKIVLIQEIL